MKNKAGQSFMMYDRMKMFVYGNSEFANCRMKQTSKFFIQFGNGDEYYKLSKPVYDTDGMKNLQRNAIDLDLDWLTSLKLQNEESIELINPNDTFVKSTEYIKYEYISEANNLSKDIEIVGNPSLSRLKYFIIGIENIGNQAIDGEVWVDELRLSGVKKENGTALRLKSEFNLSDFSSSKINYSRKDADFHILQERAGSNNKIESFSYTNSLKLGAFFPTRFGISFPVNFSYNTKKNTPKFFPGTDIKSKETVPDSILVKTSTINLSGKISKKLKSENNLAKYTIDNMSAGFNLSTSK